MRFKPANQYPQKPDYAWLGVLLDFAISGLIVYAAWGRQIAVGLRAIGLLPV